jgi:hypothetical protein
VIALHCASNGGVEVAHCIHGFFSRDWFALISSVMPSQGADFLRAALYVALCDGVMQRAKTDEQRAICDMLRDKKQSSLDMQTTLFGGLVFPPPATSAEVFS